MASKKFCLRVRYGTGQVSMIVDTCDFMKAVQMFYDEYSKSLPDTKMYGLPDILSAELTPLIYQDIYKEDK